MQVSFFTVLAIWFGYKKARDTGRNPFLWAAICGATFIGVHLLTTIGIGLFSAFCIEVWGCDPEYFYQAWYTILLSLIPSFAGIFIIFRYLDRVPKTVGRDELPPPPRFDQNGQQ